MKNSVANRSNAQCSCAGLFIEAHLKATGYPGPWLHVDMAGPAKDGELGTGWGVARALLERPRQPVTQSPTLGSRQTV
jgi:probable aminopeptidase NPEPL1